MKRLHIHALFSDLNELSGVVRCEPQVAPDEKTLGCNSGQGE
jgi:hypothetical protein